MLSSSRRAWIRLGVAVLVVLVAVAGLYALGAANPAARPAVSTDRLGPAGGDAVQEYLDGAQAGLARSEGTRWALISLRSPVDDDTAWTLIDGTAGSQIALHVTVPGVATPTAVEPITGDRGSLDTARTLAIARVDAPGDEAGVDVTTDRGARVARLVAGRLGRGCACVVALVVRGDSDRLRAIARGPLVRSVEVLPADAAGGRFTVTPLLPEQSDRVGPLPDTGPVPAS